MPAIVDRQANRMSLEEDWRRRSVLFAGDGGREEEVNMGIKFIEKKGEVKICH